MRSTHGACRIKYNGFIIYGKWKEVNCTEPSPSVSVPCLVLRISSEENSFMMLTPERVPSSTPMPSDKPGGLLAYLKSCIPNPNDTLDSWWQVTPIFKTKTIPLLLL